MGSNRNGIPSSRDETLTETTVIPIEELNTDETVPTILRKRITIAEWLSYRNSTSIIRGVFIPSQVAITTFTGFLIMGCSMAFCVLTGLKIHFAIVIATLLFMCYVLYMLRLTAFTEPGFLPRNDRNPVMLVIDRARAHGKKKKKKITVEFSERSRGRRRSDTSTILRQFTSSEFTSSEWGVAFDGYDQFDVSSVTPGSSADKKGVREGFRLLSIKVGDKEFPLTPSQDKGLRYCYTCKIARPERSKHCSDCDACCQKFDHHCPWTGTCIGLRNYTYFVRFVSSLFALIFWVLFWTISNLLGWLGTGAKSTGTLFLGGFLVVCILFVGGLGCYHVHLIARDRTTAESRRGVYRREGTEPQETDDRSGKCTDNCAKLCLSGLPPSAIISLR